MNVEIDCNVKVVGATVEEALDLMTEKLMVLRLNDADREKMAKEYHLWDNANDGDVDWTPIKFRSLKKDGGLWTEAFMTIRNV